MTANECYRPPTDAQLRYMVQWFHEWSEMQRGDFLPVLAQKLAPGTYVNGLLSGVETLSCNEGRPPSLFQCRVKLFREWFETWSQAERDQLLGHIKSMDPAFYNKVQEELETLSNKAGNGPVAALEKEEDVPAVSEENGIVQGNGEDSSEPESNIVENGDEPQDATGSINGEEENPATS
ncbi:hypothetical protein KUF71_022238 [Frankliniella fusca]|uniref:Uncharacterized protein n=1 Tax=Frankliniella fusca TaxID=407009 RepID=A0AAE1LAT6_9NEOP|nr:hypothetical protein KUF71_022238 [Frankliniella fusca]